MSAVALPLRLLLAALCAAVRAHSTVQKVVRVADNTTVFVGGSAPFDFFSAPKTAKGRAFFHGAASSANGLWVAELNGDQPPSSVKPVVRTGQGADALPGTQDPIASIGDAAGNSDAVVFFAQGISGPSSAQIMGRAPASSQAWKSYRIVDLQTASPDGGDG
jgi:hypothetical protein